MKDKDFEESILAFRKPEDDVIEHDLKGMSFAETVKLCNECEMYVQNDDMACESCCNDCSAEHDCNFMKHEG